MYVRAVSPSWMSLVKTEVSRCVAVTVDNRRQRFLPRMCFADMHKGTAVLLAGWRFSGEIIPRKKRCKVSIKPRHSVGHIAGGGYSGENEAMASGLQEPYRTTSAIKPL